jgi:hypothetical protein
MNERYLYLFDLAHDMGVEEAIKRLESPEGAERPLVPTTRSEEGPGDAEQRSAEGRAVPPGEAEPHDGIALWLRDGPDGKLDFSWTGDKSIEIDRSSPSVAGHAAWVALEALSKHYKPRAKPDSDAR